MTKYLLFLSSFNDPFRFPRHLPSSLVQNVISFVIEPLIYLGSLTLFCIQRSHTYVCIKLGYFSLVNMFHVYLIRPAERTFRIEENLFLPIICIHNCKQYYVCDDFISLNQFSMLEFPVYFSTHLYRVTTSCLDIDYAFQFQGFLLFGLYYLHRCHKSQINVQVCNQQI